jgi:hypothetical protein
MICSRSQAVAKIGEAILQRGSEVSGQLIQLGLLAGSKNRKDLGAYLLPLDERVSIVYLVLLRHRADVRFIKRTLRMQLIVLLLEFVHQRLDRGTFRCEDGFDLCPLLVREVQVPRDVLRHKVRALLLEPVR